VKASWSRTRGGTWSLVYLYALPVGAPQAGCGSGTFRVPTPHFGGSGPAVAWIDGIYHVSKKLTHEDVPGVWIWSRLDDSPILVAQGVALNGVVGEPAKLQVIEGQEIWIRELKPRLDEETLMTWRREFKSQPELAANGLSWEAYLRSRQLQHNQIGADWNLDPD
jgi:hypothetical protein